jgi:hypothetical protein
MNADQLFSASNLIALAGWMLLLAAPQWNYTPKIIFGGLIMLSMLLAVTTALVLKGRRT